MKYYLIAGEASGDLHGANLMRALREKDQEAQFRFWGGDKMALIGGSPVKHYRDTAYMGFWEVIKNIRSIFENLNFCKKDLLKYDPDFLIFIDYPGFNIRILKWAFQNGLRAKRIYYISPQVWAWKANRANLLRDTVQQMFVILPFERAFYEKYGFDVTYVGHPLLDHLAKLDFPQTIRDKYDLPDKPIIALLPGSRKQEINNLLGIMLEMVPRFPEFQFLIAAVSTVPDSVYEQAKDIPDIRVIKDDTNLVLSSATAALIASGTATLEAALMRVPLVVCYRGSQINYQIARRLIHVKYVSLVNLILDKPLVKELIQNDLNTHALELALKYILSDEGRKILLEGYQSLIDQLGGPGASIKVAEGILQHRDQTI